MNAPNRIQPSPTDIAPDAYREAMGCFATGIVIVTAIGPDNQPVGLTVDSFNSVSMDPPLVLWSLALSSPNLLAFRQSTAFIINVLSEDQLTICRQFATRDINRFTGVSWTPGLNGVPIIADTLATIECQNEQQYNGGDHEIFLGRVVCAQTREKKPLLYSQGKFSRLGNSF